MINHYGLVPPGGKIAVNLQPPLEDGDRVSLISMFPSYVSMQILNAHSLVVSNAHPKWPVAFGVIRIPRRLP